MRRLLWVLMVLMTFSAPVFAAPPLTGDMLKLEVFEKPEKLPEIMLSESPGNLVYLSEYKGKFVLLNIWATWCPPCIKELPSLNKLEGKKGSEHFKVVTVSIDQTGLDSVKKYIVEHELFYLRAFVDVNNSIQTLDALKGVAGVPVTLLLDPEMNVIARFQGDTDWTGPAAEAVIDYYLNQFSQPAE